MKNILAMACLAVSSLAGVSQAFADSKLIDFEAYPTGAIANGYDGWQITNPGWDQSVVNTDPLAGNQSWHVSNVVASGSYGDQPYTPALADAVSETSANNKFAASWLWSPEVGGQLGEGVTASIDNGTGQRGNYIRLECSNTNLDLWRLYGYDYDGANFVEVTFMSNIAAGTVLNVGFDMTFNAGLQNDVWNVTVNNATVYTGTGWEDYFIDGFPTFGPAPVTYDRLLFRAGGVQTGGATGTLIDNISYSSVPEPMTMAMAGLALAGFVARKRKKA